jgi:hypothetical protein
MKKLNFFFILLLLLFQQTLFSQNYFGQITDVDLNRPQTTSGVEAFFGLESINTDYLDSNNTKT